MSAPRTEFTNIAPEKREVTGSTPVPTTRNMQVNGVLGQSDVCGSVGLPMVASAYGKGESVVRPVMKALGSLPLRIAMSTTAVSGLSLVEPVVPLPTDRDTFLYPWFRMSPGLL